jgi:hypothetical protein
MGRAYHLRPEARCANDSQAIAPDPPRRGRLRPPGGSRHCRVEVTVGSSVTGNYGVLLLGDGAQTSLDRVPHHIILDRDYVHGHAERHREAVALEPGVLEDYLRWGLLTSVWKGGEA